MIRMLLSFFVVGIMVLMTGCHCQCTHGVCDCVPDEYCTSRSPWIRNIDAPIDHYTELNSEMLPPVNASPTVLPELVKFRKQ